MAAKFFVICTLALALGVSAPRAQTRNGSHSQLTYRCITESGHTITGDLPPPQCKDRDVRVFNPDGSLKEFIPAPLTREERRERDAADAKRMQEMHQKRQEQERKDRQIPLYREPSQQGEQI